MPLPRRFFCSFEGCQEPPLPTFLCSTHRNEINQWIDDAVALLKKINRHAPDCGDLQEGNGVCDCGLEELLMPYENT